MRKIRDLGAGERELRRDSPSPLSRRRAAPCRGVCPQALRRAAGAAESACVSCCWCARAAAGASARRRSPTPPTARAPRTASTTAAGAGRARTGCASATPGSGARGTTRTPQPGRLNPSLVSLLPDVVSQSSASTCGGTSSRQLTRVCPGAIAWACVFAGALTALLPETRREHLQPSTPEGPTCWCGAAPRSSPPLADVSARASTHAARRPTPFGSLAAFSRQRCVSDHSPTRRPPIRPPARQPSPATSPRIYVYDLPAQFSAWPNAALGLSTDFGCARTSAVKQACTQTCTRAMRLLAGEG